MSGEYGREMLRAFQVGYRHQRAEGRAGALAFCLGAAVDVIRTAPGEHIEILWRDLAYALRPLRQQRPFTLVAVIALALGIGANSAIFSVLYATPLRPLPCREPQRLVWISGSNLPGGSKTKAHPARTFSTDAAGIIHLRT